MISDVAAVLERQLLLQLGDRLKRLRTAQGFSAVEMARRVGITRNTLRSVEAGDPATSIGCYLRVMSVLGVSGELALLASDTLSPPSPGSAAARSRRPAPAVEIRVSADESRHRLQDLQSIVLHDEAVRLVKADPELRDGAKETVKRWIETGDPRSVGLWREWQAILETGAWRKALGRSRHAQQLRQASPLVTVLPEDVRANLLGQIKDLKQGIVLTTDLSPVPEDP